MTAQQSPVDGDAPDSGKQQTVNHGKENVVVYRTCATPLEGVRTIPESSFDEWDNMLFGLDVRVQVEGEEFLSSFSEGDNTKVMTTDSMKNFILHHAGEYDGATLEGFLEFVGPGFLDTYSQMSAVEVSVDEIRLDELPVLEDDGDGYKASDPVSRVSDNEPGYGSVSLARDDGTPVITDQTSGITDLELVKVKGNSFTDYVQDEYTTLPEHEDWTFYIPLGIFWSYDDPEDALGKGSERYVPSEQVRDIAHVAFDEVDSSSIQNLIYQIGLRVLERYPQLASVRLEANDRTWLSVRDDLDGDASVLRKSPAPTDFQQFSMDHGDPDKQ